MLAAIRVRQQLYTLLLPVLPGKANDYTQFSPRNCHRTKPEGTPLSSLLETFYKDLEESESDTRIAMFQNLPLSLKMAEFQEGSGILASPEWYEEDIAKGNF